MVKFFVIVPTEYFKGFSDVEIGRGTADDSEVSDRFFGKDFFTLLEEVEFDCFLERGGNVALILSAQKSSI